MPQRVRFTFMRRHIQIGYGVSINFDYRGSDIVHPPRSRQSRSFCLETKQLVFWMLDGCFLRRKRRRHVLTSEEVLEKARNDSPLVPGTIGTGERIGFPCSRASERHNRETRSLHSHHPRSAKALCPPANRTSTTGGTSGSIHS